jgi:glucose/arabinose dehydrogenase
MRVPGAWVAVVACLLVACDRSSPPQTPSPGNGGETINGRERLGWDQRAGDTAELARVRYAIYVDGARAEIAATSCAATAGANGFACTGQLPSMTPGTHALELAAFTQDDGVLESPRSAPFRVTVTASSSGPSSDTEWADGEAGVTVDGVGLQVERILDGLERPVDAGFAPDGRLFIAERGGRIRIVDDGRVQSATALPETGTLLAIALDPDFTRTRCVFTLGIGTSSRGTPVYRLARYRELRGLLGQRAVLLEHAAPAEPSGRLRFGPDGRLYVAFAAVASDGETSYSGKVLRLNADGSAPADRRAPMPVFSSGHVAPRALAWHPSGAALWIADGTPAGLEWITGIGVAEIAAPRVTWGLPEFEPTSSMAFYRGELFPEFRGNLLIASAEARRILRVGFSDDPLRAVSSEPLLADRVGPILVVLPGPDGAVYFCTETALGRVERKGGGEKAEHRIRSDRR